MRKKLLLTIALAFVMLLGVNAQEWSMTLTCIDGLPGEMIDVSGRNAYSYTSDKITLDTPLTSVRITFVESVGKGALNGYQYVALSELTVFAADGVTPINYAATSNADHNTLGGSIDGAGLAGLNDGIYTNYWHSCWMGDVAEQHHIELTFDQPVSEFSLQWTSRVGFTNLAPALVGLTPAGVEFVPYADWAFTVAEEEMASMDELLSAKYFVMKSNVPVEYDVYVNNHDSEQPFGTKANEVPLVGPGPMFVNTSAVANEPTPAYAIQLIPTDGGYYLYYLTEGRFLSATPGDNAYNGANSTQGTTSKISDAAIVTIKEVDGRFEMSYMMEYNGEKLEMHIGASPSNNRFKNVDKERYDFFKEGHPYCLNFAYIIAFDWSLYEVTMNFPVKYVSALVHNAVKEAKSLKTLMGDVAVEGYEEAYENLLAVVSKAEEMLAANGYTSYDEAFAAVNEINNAAAEYVYSKIQWYNDVFLPEFEAEYFPLLIPSATPKDGCFPEEVYFTYIHQNLIEQCAELYDAALGKPHLYITQMMNFINGVQDNIDIFLASQMRFVKLPEVYTTDDPHRTPLGVKVNGCWEWEQLITLDNGKKVDGIRLTFLETNLGSSGSDGKYNGYPMVVLSGLEILDADGNELLLTEYLVTTNSLEQSEGSLYNLFDNNASTFYHSIWSWGNFYPEGYVYLDVKFPDGVELNTFTVKTIGRSNGSLSPGTVCISEYGVEYDKLLFLENPYNVAGGTQIADESQLKDGGIYIISGNLRVKTQDAAPRYYSGVEPYHTNIDAALNAPCVYMFKKTADGWNIISLAEAKYLALNKSVSETTNEETGEVTVNKSWSTGLTVYPSNAAEVKIVKSGNLENAFVLYSDIEENNIEAAWNWTDYRGEVGDVTIEHGVVNANKFVFQDWDAGLGGRPCVSEVPGVFEYGYDIISAHPEAQAFIDGDGYSAGDCLHFNKTNGEGEWNIYEVTMDDPYYLWASRIGDVLNALGLAIGKDPGCITGDIAALEMAVDAVDAVVVNEDKAGARAAVEVFVNNIELVQSAERVEVIDGCNYAFESAYAPFYEQQGKVKAIYADAYGLNWTNAPATYDDAPKFVFQFQKYDVVNDPYGYVDSVPEEDKDNVYLIYNEYVDAYVGEGGSGTTQVQMIDDDFWAAPYIVKPLEANIYTIHAIGAAPLHTAGHGNGAGSEGTIVNWNGGAGSCSSWYLRLVGDADEVVTIDKFENNGIFYKITSAEDATVEVTFKGNNVNDYANEYSGNVVIPQNVVHDGVVYSVTGIGCGAFYNCVSLESVTIPSSVTSIEDMAFYGCEMLSAVISLAKVAPVLGVRVFDRISAAATLEYPAGCDYSSWAAYFASVDVIGVTITIDQYGYAAYYSPYALDFAEVEGLKAYTATEYDAEMQVVALTRVYSASEETGLFVVGEQGEYKVPIIEVADECEFNLFVGTLEEAVVNGVTDEGDYINLGYAIAEEGGAPVFTQFEDGSVLGANNAYLQLPASLFPEGVSKAVSVKFDDDTATGIHTVERADGNVTVHDLQGRAVKNPVKGIYIVNGKKMFVK